MTLWHYSEVKLAKWTRYNVFPCSGTLRAQNTSPGCASTLDVYAILAQFLELGYTGPNIIMQFFIDTYWPTL